MAECKRWGLRRRGQDGGRLLCRRRGRTSRAHAGEGEWHLRTGSTCRTRQTCSIQNQRFIVPDMCSSETLPELRVPRFSPTQTEPFCHPQPAPTFCIHHSLLTSPSSAPPGVSPRQVLWLVVAQPPHPSVNTHAFYDPSLPRGGGG
jgi:hypothetical protein